MFWKHNPILILSTFILLKRAYTCRPIPDSAILLIILPILTADVSRNQIAEQYQIGQTHCYVRCYLKLSYLNNRRCAILCRNCIIITKSRAEGTTLYPNSSCSQSCLRQRQHRIHIFFCCCDQFQTKHIHKHI